MVKEDSKRAKRYKMKTSSLFQLTDFSHHCYDSCKLFQNKWYPHISLQSAWNLVHKQYVAQYTNAIILHTARTVPCFLNNTECGRLGPTSLLRSTPFSVTAMQYPLEILNRHAPDLSGGPVKNPPANAGDTGRSPGLGRSCMLWGD